MRPWISALAAVTLVLGVAGCSDSDSSARSDASDEGTSSTTTAGGDADPTTSAGPLERYAGRESDIYGDLVNWVCHPDADDVCTGGLDATSVAADGTLTDQPWQAAEDPPIDCFYVYPTISQDPEEISDRVVGDEERFVTANQAARLGQECRVFAPVYRQRTLAGLTAALGGATTTTTTTTVPGASPEPSPGYADVREAFAHYMATENDGRGVVLIGHSQGASVLNQLIKDEVDPNPDVRDVLVAAYLAGSSVAVPEGEVVGGDFQNVPGCTEPDQIGCVVSWATFRSTAPPPENSLFGRPRSGDGVALCTNPADVTDRSGGSGTPVEVHPYFPSDVSGSILTSGAADGPTATWVAPSAGQITTPFVTTPGLVSTRCASRGGFNYLEATVDGDPADPRADDIGGDLTPQWGLHLQDVNLVMGDIVDLVGSQTAAFTSRN